ncbi:hypothetical protein RJ639_007313, partial [Escallonia herrerae]
MNILSRVQITLRNRWNRNPNSTQTDPVAVTEAGNPATPDTEESTERRNSPESPTTSTSLAIVEKKVETNDGPPVDDCCPICFGSFNHPCRAPCGHWYCGGCILQYWNHVSAFQPCKCPMCSRQITKLTPEASLYCQQEVEVTLVLKSVHTYNRLFVGGVYGLMLKVLQLPLFIKRGFQGMMDPDRAPGYLQKLRLFAVKFIELVVLGTLYTLGPFDFLPTGRIDAIDFFDLSAISLSFILYVVGLYLRRRRRRQVRQ